jgi:hypothetical protein
VADLSEQHTALLAELSAKPEPSASTEDPPTQRTPDSASAAAAPAQVTYDRRSPSSGSVIGSVSLRQIRVSSSPAMPSSEGGKRALIEELLDDKRADPRAH